MQLFINNEPTDYEIFETGEIYSKKTNKKLTGCILNTGYVTVTLTTSQGKKGYSLHRLVAQTFIPNDDNKPYVNHIDGDKTNNQVSNLEWVSASENRQHALSSGLAGKAYGPREKIKIDVRNSDEWRRYLTTSYYISSKGEVYNYSTQVLLKQTKNESGYIRYTLRMDGKNVSKLGHVLVMETWGPKPDDDKLIINHKDGNKANNHIENLEWCSKQENSLHSCYVLNKNVKPVVQTIEGTERYFNSVTEAAKAVGVTPGAIVFAIKNQSKCCNSDWKYR